MLQRRKHIIEFNNTDRWLVSYADLITLLFAFFVVMYSISSINEDKYRVLAQTLSQSFRLTSPTTSDTMNIQPIDNRFEETIVGETPSTKIQASTQPPIESANSEKLEDLALQIESLFQSLIESDLVQLHKTDSWIEVELKSTVLFDSGSARPSEDANTIFKEVAHLLQAHQFPIFVEGFTDNQPIATTVFPSNWELSSARAAAVVRILVENAVPGERLSAIGYGPFRPKVDNLSEEHRAQNRRVVLAIARHSNAKSRAFVEVFSDDQTTMNEPLIPPLDDFADQPIAPSAQPENTDEDRIKALKAAGVRTIRLKNGGLLFTNRVDDPSKVESDLSEAAAADQQTEQVQPKQESPQD